VVRPQDGGPFGARPSAGLAGDCLTLTKVQKWSLAQGLSTALRRIDASLLPRCNKPLACHGAVDTRRPLP